MDSAGLRRPLIALIAAYAMALHALLLAFVPAAPLSSGPLAALCAHDSGQGPGQGQPGGHDLPCAALCAAIAQGMAGPLPAGVAVVAIVAGPPAVVVPASDWIAPRRLTSGPQIPRGPPLA